MADKSVEENREMYAELSRFGPYSTLAPGNRGGPKSRYFAAAFDAALLPLIRDDPEPIRLLDFGCGSGIFSVQVGPFAERVVGIDISEDMIRLARQLADDLGQAVELVTYDGQQAPFADHEFNRVVARESLCHVPDEQLPATLSEIARVLEPGGLFYWLEQVSESPRWQRPITPWQKKRSVDELLARSEEAGFELVSMQAVRRPRFPWIYLVWFRLVPSRWIPMLARWEVAWNRRFTPVRSRRWQDDLFVFRSAALESRLVVND